MNALIKRSTILLLTIVAVGFSACKDSGNNGPAPVEAMLAEDIAANYNTLTETREPIEDVNDHSVKQILEESLEHEQKAVEKYKELLEEVTDASIMLEEYARGQIGMEEQHALEIKKMLKDYS